MNFYCNLTFAKHLHMLNYDRSTLYMDISIDETSKTILVKQKWKYNWMLSTNSTPWTYLEKKAFHHKADSLIWSIWGGQLKVNTRGTSTFAKANNGQDYSINFDLEWVLSNEHWNVNVTKIPIGSFASSSVSWNSRTINLDTEDILSRKVRTVGAIDYFQHPVAHEFGHAVGNSIFANTGMHGDEYKSTSTFFADKASIMNWGDSIRDRHIDYLLSELNLLIPNTTFHI